MLFTDAHIDQLKVARANGTMREHFRAEVTRMLGVTLADEQTPMLDALADAICNTACAIYAWQMGPSAATAIAIANAAEAERIIWTALANRTHVALERLVPSKP